MTLSRFLSLLSVACVSWVVVPWGFGDEPAADRDEALQPPRILVDPNESDYPTAVRTFQGIPGIERTAGGRLWATWYGGGPGEGPDNYTMLVTSDDDGRTWSKLKLVIDIPDSLVRSYDPCLWIDPKRRMWLFWAQSYKHFDGRCGVWAMVTHDPEAADPTWSPPRRLCDGIMMNKPTVLSDGTWLLPTAIWRTPDGCRVVASSDQGATWSLLGAADVPESDYSCDEPMIVERTGGDLWMLVRTSYGIGQSTSRDRGTTWSTVEPSDLPHPASRFFIRRLASGNLLLVKHGPLDQRTGREQLTAYVSQDDGASWQGGLMIDERQGISYPDAVEAPDGSVYLIYDRDRKGAREILMATFTEADVLAGTPSDATRLRVLVNKAR